MDHGSTRYRSSSNAQHADPVPGDPHSPHRHGVEDLPLAQAEVTATPGTYTAVGRCLSPVIGPPSPGTRPKTAADGRHALPGNGTHHRKRDRSQEFEAPLSTDVGWGPAFVCLAPIPARDHTPRHAARPTACADSPPAAAERRRPLPAAQARQLSQDGEERGCVATHRWKISAIYGSQSTGEGEVRFSAECTRLHLIRTANREIKMLISGRGCS